MGNFIYEDDESLSGGNVRFSWSDEAKESPLTSETEGTETPQKSKSGFILVDGVIKDANE